MVNVASQLTIFSSNDEGATSVFNSNRRVLQPRNLNTEPIVVQNNKTSKPKSDPIKTRLPTDSKVSLGEENDNAWPSLDKESRTPSLESEMEEPLPDIFRQRSELDEDDNDMFMLKRANPVYDSDDDEFMTSPPKRQRMSGPTVLHWGEQLSESDEFSLSHLSAP
eukprot:Nitzschia sp. Nitz4//scaffold31_size150131//82442//83414//NITZ4_002835-RA/size150131-exonerate_est2genome-gene-0.58-mRNA-1//1//CDS//3329547680//5865//frame0